MNRTAISQYLMKAAFFLGLFFIAEYWISLQVPAHLFLALVALMLKCVTPVALYLILRRLRDTLLDGELSGFMAWIYGVRAMLFAALPEAAFVYVYHQFIRPTALHEMMQATAEQLEKIQTVFGDQYINATTIDLYRNANVPSAIQSAVDMITTDMTFGIFLMLVIAPIVKRKARTGM